MLQTSSLYTVWQCYHVNHMLYLQCLCLAPTYELALQIGGVTEKMAKHMTNVQIGYAVKGERSR